MTWIDQDHDKLLLALYLIGCCVLKESMTHKAWEIKYKKTANLRDSFVTHASLETFPYRPVVTFMGKYEVKLFHTDAWERQTVPEWMRMINPCPCSSYLFWMHPPWAAVDHTESKWLAWDLWQNTHSNRLYSMLASGTGSKRHWSGCGPYLGLVSPATE